MFECYLDDSGTHQGSAVVVWGGILGHPINIQQLGEDWAALLSCPCDGKPPIRRFHSFDLMAGRGEFQGYNQAERDLTRRNFRKAITDNGLSVLAFGVSAESWREIVHEQEQMHWFTAEQIVVASAVKEIMAASKNDLVLIRFDQGRKSLEVETAIRWVVEDLETRRDFIRLEYILSESSPAMQAADLVAHEAYRHFVKRLKQEDIDLNPHTERLFMDAFDSKGSWAGRDEIADTVRRVRSRLDIPDRDRKP